MRDDSLGFFWEDKPVEKVVKEVIKKTPPERTWESPDYLPGLEEALAWPVLMMTEQDLLLSGPDEELMFDIECYPNFFCASFKSRKTGKVMVFERSPWMDFDSNYLRYVLENYCIVTFNGIKYDAVIAALACDKQPTEVLHWATEALIVHEIFAKDVLKRFKCKKLKINHIDIIEVVPLRASLKIYSGRLHAKRMQDLPFAPGTVLTWEQAQIVKHYNVNDLNNTHVVRDAIKPQIDLRCIMSNEYGIDLRSKSDAQIAEAVIADEITRLNGNRPQQPSIEQGTVYKFHVPHFLKYQTPLMQWALEVVRNADFIVGEHGAVVMPAELKELSLNLGYGTYTMGIGGLHSTESKTAHRSDVTYVLKDRDVVSYYPIIILNQQLYPQHLGGNFLRVYGGIVMRRIDAKNKGKACKKAGDKIGETHWKSISESLKITINGSFGKLGSKYSILYAPDLLIQVTLTGQLSLLMLIERLEMAGIQCVSANTDGVVIKLHRGMQATYDAIIKQWELDTNFETEEAEYLALFSRDVNNYIALKLPDETGKIEMKTKGEYANPWSDPSKIEPRFHKNPANLICMDAIELFLTKGVALVTTIMACKDVTKFISVRTVKGGAVKDSVYLGKAIRWYYSAEERDKVIVYASTGNNVPRSKGAKPLMDLQDHLPHDIDYDWYLQECLAQLTDMGFFN